MRVQLVERQIRVNEAVVSAELGDEAVLLNVDTGLYYGLGEAELIVWQLIGQGASEPEILARLLDEFDVDVDQLKADLSGFLKTLTERGIIEVISK